MAGPALLTNLATPIGSGVVLRFMAQFGDSAVAGAAIMGRIFPVAFAAVFALSGAIGPIIGQNAGAGRFDRVRSALYDALLCNVVYVLVVWLLMWLLTDAIVAAFSASGDAERLIRFATTWLIGAFMFNGMLFVANASFNNLHKAHLATLFNFGRALLGTIPCVYLGAQMVWRPRGHGRRGCRCGDIRCAGLRRRALAGAPPGPPLPIPRKHSRWTPAGALTTLPAQPFENPPCPLESCS